MFLFGHQQPRGAGALPSQRRTPSACTFSLLDVPHTTPVYRPDGSVIEVDGTGRWYEKRCKTEAPGARYVDPVLGSFYSQGSFTPRETTDLVYLHRRSADPAELVDQAFGHLPLPAPAPRTSPPAEAAVVNFSTWLWLPPEDWTPRTSKVAVPGVTVVVTAAPERVIWDLGTGDQLVCEGPGTPYDASRPEEAQHTDCAYTYARSSAGIPARGGLPANAYALTATVEWRATWSAEGAPGGGDLGIVRRTSDPLPLRVAEIQAVIVHSH